MTVSDLDFGDFDQASAACTGRKFNDLNGDGDDEGGRGIGVLRVTGNGRTRARERVPRNAPALFNIGANGQLQGNVHLRSQPGTPMANVMLSLMHRLGLDDVEEFGNSTGDFSLTV